MYSYRCDVCGCYLDPGEGDLCDECQKAVDARRRNAERINRSVLLNGYQYELRMEELKDENII